MTEEENVVTPETTEATETEAEIATPADAEETTTPAEETPTA
jgi:hypothetical protein